MSIRVLIADDHPLVRDGLRFSIERSGQDIRVVGEGADGQQILSLAANTPADVCILDITMPVMNGIEAARQLMRSFPAIRTILISLHGTRALVEEALAIGVRGYLSKETASRNVVEAITEVHAGRVYFSPDISAIIVSHIVKSPRQAQEPEPPAALTPQERKILQLIAEGLSTKEVAAHLNLAYNTVHTHRTHLMAKLKLHKQTDLVRYAIREGLAKL